MELLKSGLSQVKEIEGALIKRDVRSRRERRHEIFDIRELRFEVGGVRGFLN